MFITRILLVPALIVAGAAAIPNAAGQEAGPRLALPMERPGALAALIASDRIQNELQLTPSQKVAVHSIRVRHRDAVRRVVQVVDSNSAPSKRTAQTSIAAITAKYNTEVLPILTPGQRARLAEIESQILGGHMLLSADVREKLDLSNKQKAKLAKIYTREAADVSAINASFENGEVSNFERILALRKERQWHGDEMKKVLNKEQLADFEAMTGKPLKL